MAKITPERLMELHRLPTDAVEKIQDMLIKPIQRYIKRQVEHDIFDVILAQVEYDPAKAQVHLNWGSPKCQKLKWLTCYGLQSLGSSAQKSSAKTQPNSGGNYGNKKKAKLKLSMSSRKAKRR